ncbi:MAG: hypothetical protein B6226_03520, partial [Candidatus Cloacimonetes bacterium 4572_65]
MPYTSTPRIRGVSAGGSPSPSYKGGSAILVAASDAPALIKNRADYVCSGTDDQATIQEAINTLIDDTFSTEFRLTEGEDFRVTEGDDFRVTERNAYIGGAITLSIGTFYISDPIKVYDDITMKGSGWQT